MAINYQQILMDMNRPRRKTGGVARKLFVVVAVFAIVVGAGYAAWRFGIVNQAWDKVYSLVAGAVDQGDEEAAAMHAEAEQAVQSDMASTASNGDAAKVVLSPVSIPAPAPNGPIDIAAAGSLRPSASAVQALSSAPSASPAAPSPSRPAAPVVRAQTAAPVPAPILSDARAQMQAVDQILATDPAQALRRMEELMRTNLTPDEASEAAYRLGYAARMLRDDEKAQKFWKAAAEQYPESRGGRFSALALADTWYKMYAGAKTQISRWDEIQELYSRVLGKDDAPFLPENVRAAVKANLTRLNDSLFFGSAPTRLARYHKVEQGELLGGIANKYRVDYESIARINGVNPNRIRAGMDLKLIVGDVSVVVRKNAADPGKTPTVTWFLDGRWMREYQACVGDGNKTPVGSYSFTSKERDPSWTNPVNGQLLQNDHPENILGSRWMAMKGMNTQGLGIHGTTVDDSIPGYTSAGCVRLLNRDVEELFSYARIGGQVTVLD